MSKKVATISGESYTASRLAEDFIELSPEVDHAVIVMVFKDGTAQVSCTAMNTPMLSLCKDILHEEIAREFRGGLR